MKKYPFPHDGPVYQVCDDKYVTVYYSHKGKKYKRTRKIVMAAWELATEQEIDPNMFWMVVACIERRSRRA